MEVVYVLSSAILALLLVGGVWFINKDGKGDGLVRRVLAVVLVGVAFYRYMIEHEAVFVVRGLNMFSPFGDEMALTLFALILVWFTYAALLMTVMDQFFDCNRIFDVFQKLFKLNRKIRKNIRSKSPTIHGYH